MSSIEIVSPKSTQSTRDDVAAEKPGANPDAGKKFGELMDRTLARTGQKPPTRETQAARKPAKKSQAVAKTADDDSDADAAPDDKNTVSTAQPKTDPATVPPTLVLPLQILPIPVTVEVAKSLSAQAATGDTKTPSADGAISSSVLPSDLQIASSRALFGFPTGNASTKSGATGTPTTAAAKNTQVSADAKALATVTAVSGRADTQPDMDPDQLKPAKDEHVPVAKGADVPVSPIPSNSKENADGAGDSSPKNGVENSLLQAAEVAMAAAGKGDEKPDLGKKASKNAVLTVQNAGGISAAQQDVQMKKVDKKNKFAGSGEKVLPETAATLNLGDNLPASDKSSVVPVSFDRVERIENTSLNTASPERPVEVASASVSNVAVASAVVDIRARAVERAGDILALQSMRLSDMSADSLKVTIRPGAGIELAVELHHGEKGIEATATLKTGDYHFLNSNWPDLQQRMEARGVRLSPLANSEQLPNGNTSQFQQPRRQAGQQDDAAFAGAFADFVMAGSIAKQAVQGAASRGFESWA